METPPVPPMDDVMLDQEHFTSLSHLLRCYSSLLHIVESIMALYGPSPEMNRPCVNVFGAPRRVLTAESLCKGGHWNNRKDNPTYQDQPFISLFPYLETQFVASGVPALLCITCKAPSRLFEPWAPISCRAWAVTAGVETLAVRSLTLLDIFFSFDLDSWTIAPPYLISRSFCSPNQQACSGRRGLQ